MTKPQGKRHVVVVTPEQSLIMELWGYRQEFLPKIYNKTFKYLRVHKLIDKDGNIYNRVEI